MEVELDADRTTHSPPPVGSGASVSSPNSDRESEEDSPRENEKSATTNAVDADKSNSPTLKVLGQVLKFELTEELDTENGGKKKNLVVSVVDEESGEVIRRIPPDEISALRHFSRLLGLILDRAV